MIAFWWPSRCCMWVTHLFCSFSGGSALIWGNPVTEASQRPPISVQLLSAPRPKNKQNDELDADPALTGTLFSLAQTRLYPHIQSTLFILWYFELLIVSTFLHLSFVFVKDFSVYALLVYKYADDQTYHVCKLILLCWIFHPWNEL